MKKVLYIVIAAVIAICAVACKKDTAKEADQNLTKAVSALTVPRIIKDGVTLTECTYADRVLTYRFEVDKQTYNRMNAEKSESNAFKQLTTGLFSRDLLRTLNEAKASVRYILACGDESTDFTFDPEQLQTPN